MKELCYPFESAYILKNRKKIKRELLSLETTRLKKKIAVLGGSSTDDIISALELFLLDTGIEPTFYQSEYNRYWEDAVFGTPALDPFEPDVIFIHTSAVNLSYFKFDVSANENDIESMLKKQYTHFETAWKHLEKRYSCPIIQNNFEQPLYRTLGNREVWDIHGRISFINRLNTLFYKYAQTHENFFINDINYISAQYGLKEWSAPKYYYMYKYIMCPQAIPEFAFNLCNIIKSLFGFNKKALALDLDNTIWGGIIGDSGTDSLEMNSETPQGEAFRAFQKYILELAQLGIPLSVCSKNDLETAIEGLENPECLLKPKDFISIKSDWERKDLNIRKIASELGLLPESFVLADDNPAEREIVSAIGAAVPTLDSPEEYVRTLDRCGYFETTRFSADDIARNDMYRANVQRTQFAEGFENYCDYLESLKMTAVISSFSSGLLERITQLINKSNQFNLTAKRYSQNEIEKIAADANYITLYGRLADKFGDNGIVTAVIGKISGSELHIELWVMSCRVLKRNMEFAVMDTLAEECRKKNIFTVYGYYYKTRKNQMVCRLFEEFGFELISENENDSKWCLEINCYENKNNVINVRKNDSL